MRKTRISSIKSDELIRQKQKQVAIAASKIIIEKGFSNTSVREIAEAAGLTIGSEFT